jgi:hypothetical protein
MTRRTTQQAWGGRRLALLWGLGVAAGCAVAVAVLVRIGSGRAGPSPGTPSVWAGGQFRLFASVAGASTLLLAGLSGLLVYRARRPGRPRPGSEDGTAIIEFALIFPILLIVAMLLAQSSLLMGGYLCVNYASYTAARAAVVVVPENLAGEPRNYVALLEGSASEKLARIHRAAAWAVLPVSNGSYAGRSPYDAALVENLREVYLQYGLEPPHWVGDRIAAQLGYAEDHTTVELSPPDNPDYLREADEGFLQFYAPREDLTVRVRHDLYLSVPYADRILAELDADHAVDLGEGKYALRVDIPCTLSNEGVRDTIEGEGGTDSE